MHAHCRVNNIIFITSFYTMTIITIVDILYRCMYIHDLDVTMATVCWYSGSSLIRTLLGQIIRINICTQNAMDIRILQNMILYKHYTTIHSSTVSTLSSTTLAKPPLLTPPTIIILSGDGLTTKQSLLLLDMEPISTHCPSTS